MSARQSGAASGSTPLPPEEYESLIERLRETADAVIPRNATVLVVSRGDDELLHLGPRRGMHFPQDEFGRYPGYHPEDSETAIATLENMRTRGGEYLLLPSTAFWWLDYYEDFRDHLESNYPPIVSGDDCMIFELTGSGVQPGEPDADTDPVSAATSNRRLAGPLDELLRALLPSEARIALVTTDGNGGLPSFPNSTAARPPDGPARLSGLLAQAQAAGAEYLVIPATAFERVHDGRRPAAPPGGWRLVTRQEHVCEVYEREPSAAGRQTADRGPRPAHAGVWQRIRRLLRR